MPEIDVNNGILLFSINLINSFSLFEFFIPLPAITTGREDLLIALLNLLISS